MAAPKFNQKHLAREQHTHTEAEGAAADWNKHCSSVCAPFLTAHSDNRHTVKLQTHSERWRPEERTTGFQRCRLQMASDST